MLALQTPPAGTVRVGVVIELALKIAVSPPILYPTPTMTELGETYSIPQKIHDFSVDLRLDVAGEACRARGDG